MFPKLGFAINFCMLHSIVTYSSLGDVLTCIDNTCRSGFLNMRPFLVIFLVISQYKPLPLHGHGLD